MHLGFTPFNHIARFQPWQVFEPQARRFGFAMTELPRLDGLGWRLDGSANNADRILDAPTFDGCSHQQTHEIKRFGLFALLAVKVTRAANRQMRAWRMGDHQIPAVTQYLLDRTLQVPLRITLTWQ